MKTAFWTKNYEASIEQEGILGTKIKSTIQSTSNDKQKHRCPFLWLLMATAVRAREVEGFCDNLELLNKKVLMCLSSAESW